MRNTECWRQHQTSPVSLSFPHPAQPAFPVLIPGSAFARGWMEGFVVHTPQISTGLEVLPT